MKAATGGIGRIVVATVLLGTVVPLSLGAAAPDSPPPVLVAICDANEKGERLKFWGRVLDYNGRPLSKASVIAYHADREGLYNPPHGPTRVPRLRAVAITDAEGRFGFSSVRPAAYPNGSEPAHIHMIVTAPAHHVRHWEVWFEGDPLITASRRQRADDNPLLNIVKLVRDAQGSWTFHNDIRLEGN